MFPRKDSSDLTLMRREHAEQQSAQNYQVLQKKHVKQEGMGELNMYYYCYSSSR